MCFKKSILLFIAFIPLICFAQNTEELSSLKINAASQNPQFGYSEKNGKFAITDRDRVISAYKYDDKYCNSYTEVDKNNNKIVTYVFLDENKNEIVKSHEKFETVWDKNNYLTYDDLKKTYYFTYKSKKYLISKEFRECLFYPLPIESETFIDFQNKTFHTLNSQIENNRKYNPQTGFYRGRCIVLEHKNGKDVYKIINEKMKVTKVLRFRNNERLFFGPINNFNFNKFGQVIFCSSSSLDAGLIDYEGNFVYERSNDKVNNSSILEVYEGLYEIVEVDNEDKKTHLYMNQLGEKIECEKCEFKKGIDENYLMTNGEIVYKIDLNNNFKQ